MDARLTFSAPVGSGPSTPALGGYRADIDGLRAVAVAGVILFHYGAGGGGGYVGVDVFFVISGFLIASILRDDERRGRFTLLGFAERRARRLLPALAVVLLFCCAAGTRLLPNDLKLIGLGLIDAAVFASNVLFASLAEDYFTTGALVLQPALHTWSLGLEAQFYVVIAGVWAAGRRWSLRLPLVLAALGLASSVWSLWSVAHRPEAAFYLLPSRFWEFIAGAALAAGRLRPRGPLAAGLCAALGLGLIGAAMLLFSPATPFPGAAALLPCLGATLVIAGGHGRNPVSALLGARPLAVAGRLSYGLYLWHWPLLVFASYGRAAPLPLRERLVLVALTGLLAALSHRWVEQPIIARRRLAARGPFLLACGGSVAGLALCGLVINLAGQNLVRLAALPADVRRFSDGQFDTVDGRCPASGSDRASCRFGAAGRDATVVLWGNSFARMWTPGLDAAARRHGVAGIDLLMSKCPPLVGEPFPAVRSCAEFNRDALAFIAARPGLTTVILGANWTQWPTELPALRATVAALQARGRRVAVILSPPAVPYPVPRTLALAALRHDPAPPLVAEAAARAQRAPADAVIGAVAAERPVIEIDPFAAFCDGGGCRVQAEGRALYYDDAHVTATAATAASTLFDPLFASPPVAR